MVETGSKYYYLQCVITSDILVDEYGCMIVWDTYSEAKQYIEKLPDPWYWNVIPCSEERIDQ